MFTKQVLDSIFNKMLTSEYEAEEVISLGTHLNKIFNYNKFKVSQLISVHLSVRLKKESLETLLLMSLHMSTVYMCCAHVQRCEQ